MSITRTSAALAALSILAGCGAGVATTTATTVTTEVVYESLTKAVYDSTTDTLTISSLPFDNGAADATYTRNAALDTNGMKAYVNTGGQRTYVALWGISNNGAGSTSAGVVATGDYLSFGFGGNAYGRSGTTTLPTSGLANYTGRYAGLLTYDGKAGYDRTTGTVAIQVDFVDAKIEGQVTGRQNLTTATAQNDVSLATASIADGKFNGTATSFNGATKVEEGSYKGIFGGATGLEIAGVIVLTSSAGALPTKETGIFVTDTGALLP